jgi:hypothetical protein
VLQLNVSARSLLRQAHSRNRWLPIPFDDLESQPTLTEPKCGWIKNLRGAVVFEQAANGYINLSWMAESEDELDLCLVSAIRSAVLAKVGSHSVFCSRVVQSARSQKRVSFRCPSGVLQVSFRCPPYSSPTIAWPAKRSVGK